MTTAEFDSFFRQNPRKQLTLTFSDNTVLTNSQIVSESMTLEESLCSDENLYYGACESSCFTIRIAYTNKSFKGLYVNVGMTVEGINYILSTDDDDLLVDDAANYLVAPGSATFSLGNYLVVSDVPTNDRQYRDLTCYDKMYEIADLDVSAWYKGLTFPMTLKAFRDSLFTHLNVTQATATLVNDSYSIVGGFSTEELLCREVLVSICELNGVFGHIDKSTGKFMYVDLSSVDTVEYPYYVNGSGAYEDYVTDKITGVESKSSADDVGTLVGTRTNLYTIIGNLCLYGDEGNATTTTALTNLFNKIKNFQFRPFTVQTYGNPMLPLGTNVVFDTTYQTVDSYVIKKYLTGIQAMKDALTATGEKVYPNDDSRFTSQIARLKGTTHKMVVDVNTLWSEIYDANTGIKSEIQQLSSEILLKVDNNGKIVKVALSADPSTGTEFKVSADNISFIANGKIELTSNSLEIDSTYFKVDENGNITATSGTIGGFTIGSETLNGVAIDIFAGRSGSGYYVPGYIKMSASNSTTEYLYINGDGGISGTYGDVNFGISAGSALGPLMSLTDLNSLVYPNKATQAYYFSWGIYANRNDETNGRNDFDIVLGPNEDGTLYVRGSDISFGDYPSLSTALSTPPKQLITASIGSGAADHAAALQSWFNSYKTTIPRNKLISPYSQASSNGEQYMGYFLNGYDSTPYGGFYVAHYNKAYYVGIQNGTYTQNEIAFTDNVSRLATQSWGTTMSFTLASFAVPFFVITNSACFVVFANGDLSGTYNLNARCVGTQTSKTSSGTGTRTVSFTSTEAGISTTVSISLNTSKGVTVTLGTSGQMAAYYH